MSGTGYKRWTPNEMLRIGVHSLPLADSGDKLEILRVGMRTSLPRSRWKTLADLKRMVAPANWVRFQDYLTKAAKLPEAERTRIIEQSAEETGHGKDAGEPAPPPLAVAQAAIAQPVDAGKSRSVRWNELEWALIARRVKYMQDQGDTRENIGRVIFDAQAFELQPERHRALGGLLQSNYAPPSLPNSKTNDSALRAAQLNIGKLLRSHPFRPEGNFAPPPPAVEPVAAAEPVTFNIPTTIAEVRQVERSALPGYIDPGPLPDEPQTLQAGIAQAFAQQMQAAVEGMLHAHAAAIADALQGHIAREMAQWAASIERTLHHGVHHVLERELGGPVAPHSSPVVPPPPAPPPETPPTLKRLLRVDVVGLVGQNIELVRKSFNGSVDLKFIDPDQIDGWAPHTGRHAVVTLKWVPHKAKNKLRTVGVVPNMVMGGVGSVIHAIEELARKEGVELAH